MSPQHSNRSRLLEGAIRCLEQLPAEDPVRVFVSWLCLYARDILSCTLPGPYDQHAAERYAREALMPEQEFLPVAGDPAAELAARFNVPPEQIDARLIDLAARLIDA